MRDWIEALLGVLGCGGFAVLGCLMSAAKIALYLFLFVWLLRYCGFLG